jgi:hypothetical protein
MQIQSTQKAKSKLHNYQLHKGLSALPTLPPMNPSLHSCECDCKLKQSGYTKRIVNTMLPPIVPTPTGAGVYQLVLKWSLTKRDGNNNASNYRPSPPQVYFLDLKAIIASLPSVNHCFCLGNLCSPSQASVFSLELGTTPARSKGKKG